VRLGAIARAAAPLALAALVPAAAAVAEEAPKPDGRFKLGPVYLTPRIFLRNAGVDTNVFNAESGEVADTSVTLSPMLDAVVPVGSRLRLSGDGRLGFNYFRREKSERSTDMVGSGLAELYVGPLVLFGGAEAGRFRQRFSIEIDERLERREAGANAGVRLSLGRKLVTTVTAARKESTYESGVLVQGDDVKAALDRRTETGTVQLDYAITPRTSLQASARAQEDRFLAETRPELDSASSFLYQGGFSFSPSAFINGKVLAGVREYRRESDQAVPPFRGLNLSIDASMPFLLRSRLNVLAGRDVFYAVTRARTRDGSQRNTYVSLRYGGNLTFELPWSLIGRVSGEIEKADYLLPYELDGAGVDRVDRLRTAGLTLLRAFGRSLRVGGTVEWSRRTSNFPGLGYKRMSYGLTAELAP
jgi:hypothetical protein